MKKLLLTTMCALALTASACLTGGGGSWGSGTYTPPPTTGGGTKAEIENTNGESTIILLPDTTISSSDPDAMLIALPAPFKVKVVNLSSSRNINHIELQYRNASGAWITIRKIVNPNYTVTTPNAVSWFGLYPLDGKMGYGRGDTFYLRLYISDGLNETLDYESTAVDSTNPYYFKFKIDANRRAH